MTSPPSLQPKQCHRPTVGRTWKDGLFSSWNGHSPFNDPTPAGRSATCSPTTSSIFDWSRTVSTSSRRILTSGVYVQHHHPPDISGVDAGCSGGQVPMQIDGASVGQRRDLVDHSPQPTGI